MVRKQAFKSILGNGAVTRTISQLFFSFSFSFSFFLFFFFFFLH